MYLLRLDDASEYLDTERWLLMETILDKYDIRPIIGVIPRNQDQSLIEKYEHNTNFWDLIKKWELKGWTIGLHGYTHVFQTFEGGINPVNNYSEFAGLALSTQREKIQMGVRILSEHGFFPEVFFAPAHTFDSNTIEALKLESGIRVIIDTVASDVYYKNGFYFVPQQSGQVRRLPFKIVTFCYHPNSRGVLISNAW